MSDLQAVSAEWLETIDALRFATGEAQRHCFMHRLAFRRFLGPDVTGLDCLAFFETHRAAFQEAAAIKSAALSAGTNFHINSRDLARAFRPGGEND